MRPAGLLQPLKILE
jgi:hypothetical protein